MLPERLDAVLAVVYLVFNEGWGGRRVDLASEAIRLGRALVELTPDEAEVLGLLALMLLNDSRRAARFAGELVLLDDQDRSLWNEAQITEGRALLGRALALLGNPPTSFRLRSPDSAVVLRHESLMPARLSLRRPIPSVGSSKGDPRAQAPSP